MLPLAPGFFYQRRAWSRAARKRPAIPVPLHNHSNQCYQNSVIQLLRSSSSLVRLLGEEGVDFAPRTAENSRSLQFAAALRDALRFDSDAGLLSRKSRWLGFSLNRQDDAHRFLDAVLNGSSAGFGGVVEALCGTTLTRTTRCTRASCRHESTCITPAELGLSLPVPSTGKHTVAHLLGLFSQPEAVDEDYKCEGCGRCGCCSSILESIGHSEVLVLALKFNTNDERKKLRRGLVKLSQGLQVGSSNFLLCGTVVHLGGYTDAGHYIARCKGPDKKWRVYNDGAPPVVCSYADVCRACERDVCLVLYQRASVAALPSLQAPPTNGWASFGDDDDESDTESSDSDDENPPPPPPPRAEDDRGGKRRKKRPCVNEPPQPPPDDARQPWSRLRALCDEDAPNGVDPDTFAQEIEEHAAKLVGDWRRLGLGEQPEPDEARGGDDAFSIACMCARVGRLAPVLEMLLDEKDGLGFEPNHVTSSGRTLLHIAAEFNNFAAVACLIRQGADLMLRDVEQRLPLHVAAAEATAATVMLLLTETGEAAKTLEQDGDENTATLADGWLLKDKSDQGTPVDIARARTDGENGRFVSEVLENGGWDDAWFKDVERDPGECSERIRMILRGELVDDSEDERRGGDDDDDSARGHDAGPGQGRGASPERDDDDDNVESSQKKGPPRRRSERLKALERRAETAETSDDDSSDKPFHAPDEDNEEEEEIDASDSDDVAPTASTSRYGRQSLFDRVRAAKRRGDNAALAKLMGALGSEYDGWTKGDDLPDCDLKKWLEFGHAMASDALSYDLVQRLVDACVTAKVQPPTPCDEYTLEDYVQMLRDWRASLSTRCRFKREELAQLAKEVKSLLWESRKAMMKNARRKPDVCERCLGRALTVLDFEPDVDEVEYGTPHEPPYFRLPRGGVAVVLNERDLVRDHLWLSVVFRGWFCKPCNNLLHDVDTRSTASYRAFQRRVGRNCRTFSRSGDATADDIVDALRADYAASSGEMDWVALGKDGAGLFRAPPELNFFWGPVPEPPTPAQTSRPRRSCAAYAEAAAPSAPRSRPRRARADVEEPAAPPARRSRPKRGRADAEEAAAPPARTSRPRRNCAAYAEAAAPPPRRLQ
jgi:ubiquitin C-terminal hydrolase